MIAKFPARCRYCSRPIEVGRDEYDIDSKNSFHLECHENQPPSHEQFELAARLGFVGPDAPFPFESWRTHKVEEEKPKQARLQL